MKYENYKIQFMQAAITGLLSNGSFFDKKIQDQCDKLSITPSDLIAISALDIANACIKELNNPH